jgi:hypothetical protein
MSTTTSDANYYVPKPSEYLHHLYPQIRTPHPINTTSTSQHQNVVYGRETYTHTMPPSYDTITNATQHTSSRQSYNIKPDNHIATTNRDDILDNSNSHIYAEQFDNRSVTSRRTLPPNYDTLSCAIPIN